MRTFLEAMSNNAGYHKCEFFAFILIEIMKEIPAGLKAIC